jgi:4-hydroxy-2-oxoheptanedioate aldolase
MQTNSAKHNLASGKCVYGTSLEDCLSPELPVVLAAAGLDFFFVDTEHSPASYDRIQTLCRSGRGAGIIPLVRVTNNEPSLISRALDVGAMGVILPRIRSVAEVKAAVQVVKFPPLGRRGFGLRTIISDLDERPAKEQIESANRETMLVPMIETREALACVEEIAGVAGVDALFIGPYDLTLSLGILQEFENPVFWVAVDRVIAAAQKAGIAAGLQSSDLELLLETRRRGGRFLLYSSDLSVLLEGYRRAIGQLKGLKAVGHVQS